jgi:hypothetical protein
LKATFALEPAGVPDPTMELLMKLVDDIIADNAKKR